MKVIALSIAVLLAAATAGQAQTLTCKRTNISQGGFNNIKVAESWFPASNTYEIKGGIAQSDKFGRGSVRKSGNRLLMEFPVKTQKGRGLTMKVTYFPKTGRYTAKMASGARYQQITGAGGKCASRG
ncbi:hypothetical protein [Actibacterium sp. 188UL27-1]|uniref:hypothetical protein n=1 Tax=Actibacterium sp. 188UL27-1 TaxID=2786961 RepID=UPI00195D19E3|nr:hypothetical protein [Actibacterium sp. 188UL27-1]MBM7066972.1 hypothetical protein [Actibacterium sp. 188UL27-1]